MPFACSKARARLGAVAGLLMLAACTSNGDSPASAPPPSAAAARGVVRIGVWQAADPSLSTYGGAATRSLIYPQLFRATPAGRWEPSIVVSGSDRTAPDKRSARFRIRRDARWSDGTRIGVDDLRRSADARFVATIDGPDARGDIVVRFTQKLPGWRRLWSGLDTITPPSTDVYGGPYKLERVTPNFETVLRANTRYFAPVGFREVRFVLVPQAEVAVRLMERGELDVIAPPAFTDRTQRLRRIKNARVLRGGTRGGISVALVANPARLPLAQRRSLTSLVDARRFVDVVLHDEAVFDGRTTPRTTPPTTTQVPSVIEPVESPAVTQFVHAMQRRGRLADVTFDLRQDEFDQVLGAYGRGDFDLFVRVQPNLPDRCWVCEASSVNAALASQADARVAGAQAQLEAQMREAAIVVALWREVPVVAVRRDIDGVVPNGFSAAGPAWNVADWKFRN